MSQKFAQNRSSSYGFRDIFNVLFYVPLKFKISYGLFTISYFPLNSNFSLLYRILLYYPMGQKFAQNRSISYGCRGYSFSTLWVTNSLKIALSLMVSEIFSMFYFPLKFKMATNFPFCTEYSSTTLQVKNSLKIAEPLMVSEIFIVFYFPP